MTNRNILLGRSKPSERLTREEIAALDKADRPSRSSRAGGEAEAARYEGRWLAADRPQGPPQVPLEPRVPRLRFQGHRRRPAQARAAPGEVRAMQSGPRPGRRVTLRTTFFMERSQQWLGPA